MTKFYILCILAYQAIVHGFDPRVVAAQVFVESSFRPHVVNRGCFGLMQISYRTWRKELNLDRSRMLEVNYNIAHGMQILQICMKYAKGDLWRALEIYNAGFRYDGRPYVRKIRGVMEGIKNKGEQNGIY
jgi:soluble lytic murein transglycosylase-like protein